MARYVARRVAYTIVLLALATAFLFGLSRARGDPRQLYLTEGSYTTQARWDEWGREMGLDKPLVVQYFIWVSKAIHADFGKSLLTKQDAWSMVRHRMPATMQLSGIAFVLSFLIAVPLGVMSAVKRGTLYDIAARVFALLGQGLPQFWVALMFILIFAVYLGWFPTSSMQGPKSFVLPAVTLAWAATSSTLRLVRTSMLETLEAEYITLARAKGVSPTFVVWKHALRNALLAPLTHFGLLFAAFMTGTVVVEEIFAWPGVGRLAINAVFTNDFPVVAAVVMFFVVVYAGVSLFVDVLYAVVDPRITV
jgi:peptide/nickel transport system permease protein